LREQQPPDITVLPNSLLISLAEPVRRATGRPVGVTLQGEDLFIAGLGDPWRNDVVELIRSHVRHVDAFFAVSEQYARFMASYLDIAPQKMHVLPLGVNVDALDPRGPRQGSGARVGFFGRIAPEKGLHLLCDAYQRLRARGDFTDVTLEAAGYLAPEHHQYLREIEDRMRGWGLASDFRYHGALDRDAKAAFLRTLDVFSLPAVYDEPKGLSVLEAMACGVPVVQPRRGAFPEILTKTGGGLLVAPDDPGALADGLASVLKDPAHAAALGQAGAAGVRRHYSVARMADRALEIYGALAGSAARKAAC
jgi:glycosyltransferase involved in cell wall biosynthesis